MLGGDRLSVLVAPAGTGKTTTLAAMAEAWRFTGRHILALAPSTRAAKELADATGLPADTVAKYQHENQQPQVDPRYRPQLGTVVIVDETSMLATRDLDQLHHDVETGGKLPALAKRLDAPSLGAVHRLKESWERKASMQLRAGDPACIESYLDHGRVHVIESQADPYEEVLNEYQRRTAMRHADPRTTLRYDMAKTNLDRHAAHAVAAYLAGMSTG